MKYHKILLISEGYASGANKIMQSLAQKLKQEGHKIQVLLRHGTTPDQTNSLLHSALYHNLEYNQYIDHETTNNQTHYFRRHIELNNEYLFFSQNASQSYTDINDIIQLLKFIPDYIIVGNTHNFLTFEDLNKLSDRTAANVYLLTLDMSHLTGGCHFNWECDGYIKGCDQVRCPAVKEEYDDTISSNNFLHKKNQLEEGNIKVIAGTDWMLNKTKKSLLFKKQDEIINLPGFVDVSIFNNKNRKLARTIFELEDNLFYILHGCENTHDIRKGYKYFVETLEKLWNILSPQDRIKIRILTVSKFHNEKHNRIPFQKKHIDYIQDDRLLSYLYQSADIFLNTSIEDVGPSMLLEALVCGTPTISFRMGAAEESIIHKENGYLVDLYDTEKMAKSIKDFFQIPSHEKNMVRQAAHELIKHRIDRDRITESLLNHLKKEPAIGYSSCVALCTYNGQKYIREQLNSLLSQNHPLDEIVICDDRSTDSTWKILEEYQEKHPKLIKIHLNEKPLGTIKNFEKAINLCTKDIVFLSDQDDIWHIQKVKRILRYFLKNQEANALFHDLNIQIDQSKTYEQFSMWDTLSYTKKVREQIPIYHFLTLFGNVATGMAMAFRNPNSPINLANDKSSAFLHDYQLALLFAKKGQLYMIDECLAMYRQHDNQQIGCNTNAKFIDFIPHFSIYSLKYETILMRIKHLKNSNTPNILKDELINFLEKEKKNLTKQEGHILLHIKYLKTKIKRYLRVFFR